MKIAKLSLVLFLFLQINAQPFPAFEPGRLFTVNDTADTPDALPGDGLCADINGKCTLRAAIGEANNNGRNVIIFSLSYPAVIELANGELALTGNNTSIVGPGARLLTLRRSAASLPSRIFHIPSSGTNAVIRGLTISGGNAGQLISGGGIRIGPNCSLTLNETVVSGNSAGNGGGIANDGSLTVSRSLFVGNTAGAGGGALSLSSASSTRITNSTVTGNTAQNGGAIHVDGSLFSVNNTLAGNTAGIEASAVFAGNSASTSFLNTIIGADPMLPITSLRGAFTTLGNNIVTDARGSTGFTNGTMGDQVSDNNAINPLLGALADNGGQTDTRALLAGSPAINAGNSCVADLVNPCTGIPGPLPLRLLWDQRVGRSRNSMGTVVDIGAFEVGEPPVFNFGVSVGFSSMHSPQDSGAIVVLIDVTTGEMKFRPIGLAGGYRFRGLDGKQVYVIDIRRKRGPGTAPRVLAFDLESRFGGLASMSIAK